MTRGRAVRHVALTMMATLVVVLGTTGPVGLAAAMASTAPDGAGTSVETTTPTTPTTATTPDSSGGSVADSGPSAEGSPSADDTDVNAVALTLGIVGVVALIGVAVWWMLRRDDPDGRIHPPEPPSVSDLI